MVMRIAVRGMPCMYGMVVWKTMMQYEEGMDGGGDKGGMVVR